MSKPTETDSTGPSEARTKHFIRQMIDEHVAQGRWGEPGDASVITTRFPPEPNGFLHIGHAKSICLNFGLAEEYGGRCNLRFDDTNPSKEEHRYVEAIIEDIKWLGFRWPGAGEGQLGVLFASDYFQFMHDCAVDLIEKGKAYVDEQSPEQIRAGRGSTTEPGTDSPFRDRPVEESLDLFEKMKAGEFKDGSRVLRARIDMKHPNFNMRDPVMYRVVNASHHRTGDDWHIYPMYDWAHGLEDSIEGITNSLCTLEFEDHRPLYDWFINSINEGRDEADKIHHPQQTEFARLNFTYTSMSKRRMLQLVQEGHAEDWDDPRMITVSGFRRRGYTPESIRKLCEEVGVTKFNSLIDFGKLENACRDHLNKVAPRRMAVLRPLKVTIEDWPEGQVDQLEAVNNPEDESAGVRTVPFGRTIYIEQDDFMEDAPKKFFRLRPGGEVRLRAAYWITCKQVIKNDAGEVIELICTHDPETRGGGNPPPDAEGKVRKVKGTLHWVSAEHAVDAEVRLFDRMYNAEKPGKATGDHLDDVNPDSLEVVHAKLEPALAEKAPDEPDWPDGIRRFQFERLGYFCEDKTSQPDKPVFNRTVTLKDGWAKATR